MQERSLTWSPHLSPRRQVCTTTMLLSCNITLHTSGAAPALHTLVLQRCSRQLSQSHGLHLLSEAVWEALLKTYKDAGLAMAKAQGVCCIALRALSSNCPSCPFAWRRAPAARGFHRAEQR